MPQVQHAGRKSPVLAPHAAANEPNEEVGILPPPTGECRIEAIDPVEVIAKASHVAGAGTLPAPPPELAQGTKRKSEQGSDPIDVPPPALRQKMLEPPAFRLEPAREHALAQCGRQQNPIAGHEKRRFGKP